MSDVIPKEVIEKNIFVIRGHKVIPDKVLAELYGVETRSLNQAVTRNINRFPSDFVFELEREEIERISQYVISLKFSKRVLVFTEQGVAMLSSVLRSQRAVDVNIAIMRAFVSLRQILLSNKDLALKLQELENKVGKQGDEIQAIFHAIRQLMTPPEKPKRWIGFHPPNQNKGVKQQRKFLK